MKFKYLIIFLLFFSLYNCVPSKGYSLLGNSKVEKKCFEGQKILGDLLIKCNNDSTSKVACELFLSNENMGLYIMSVNKPVFDYQIRLGALNSEGVIRMYVDNSINSIVLRGNIKYSYVINEIDSNKFIGQLMHLNYCSTKEKVEQPPL